ncbi:MULTISPECIES: YheC/YheD family endospore coat-associated protein [Bacillus]|uniref:YheC/YheD family endospore coat-associated protein n=1 Tax=Bacillus TaxID=1386 RepID=UPI000BB9A08B|nr:MULTISPECIES: YheC/YheD family protein [Bacillus]
MTITLGILTFSNPTKSSYMTNIAIHSIKYDVQVYSFSPAKIFLGKNEVFGYLFCRETRSWKKSQFPLPSFIYDRLYYPSSLQSKSYIEKITWLKNNRNITFLGCGLPNKWDVIQQLHSDEELQPYFLPTRSYTISTFKKMVSMYKEVILKPINGSQGFGIIKAKQSSHDGLDCMEVTRDGERHFTFHTLQKFNKWIQSKETNFIIQPFLSLLTAKKEPFDLRILLQKGSDGEWLERFKAIRHGRVGKITANLATGGEIVTYKEWIKKFSTIEQIALEETISYLVETLVNTLDKKFHPLFEIGLDLAIDCNLKPWILDINSKPGHKMIEITASEQIKQQTYEAPARYSVFLKNKSVKNVSVDF